MEWIPLSSSARWRRRWIRRRWSWRNTKQRSPFFFFFWGGGWDVHRHLHVAFIPNITPFDIGSKRVSCPIYSIKKGRIVFFFSACWCLFCSLPHASIFKPWIGVPSWCKTDHQDPSPTQWVMEVPSTSIVAPWLKQFFLLSLRCFVNCLDLT